MLRHIGQRELTLAMGGYIQQKVAVEGRDANLPELLVEEQMLQFLAMSGWNVKRGVSWKPAWNARSTKQLDVVACAGRSVSEPYNAAYELKILRYADNGRGALDDLLLDSMRLAFIHAKGIAKTTNQFVVSSVASLSDLVPVNANAARTGLERWPYLFGAMSFATRGDIKDWMEAARVRRDGRSPSAHAAYLQQAFDTFGTFCGGKKRAPVRVALDALTEGFNKSDACGPEIVAIAQVLQKLGFSGIEFRDGVSCHVPAPVDGQRDLVQDVTVRFRDYLVTACIVHPVKKASS